MRKEPLTFSEWCEQEDIESTYQKFYDDYGDLACSAIEYMERHYQEYLQEFKEQNLNL